MAIVYYLISEASKGDNVMAGLIKYSEDLKERVDKFVERKFSVDECVPDIGEEAKLTKRISSFLPFRKVSLPSGHLLGSDIPVFLKVSIPFPDFPKPDIILELS